MLISVKNAPSCYGSLGSQEVEMPRISRRPIISLDEKEFLEFAEEVRARFNGSKAGNGPAYDRFTVTRDGAGIVVQACRVDINPPLTPYDATGVEMRDAILTMMRQRRLSGACAVERKLGPGLEGMMVHEHNVRKMKRAIAAYLED